MKTPRSSSSAPRFVSPSLPSPVISLEVPRDADASALVKSGDLLPVSSAAVDSSTLPGPAVASGLEAWSPDHLFLIGWLALPVGMRRPRSVTELALLIGVSRQRLYQWQSIPGFWDAVRATARSWGLRYHSEVLEVLIRAALRGEPWAVSRYLDMVEPRAGVRSPASGDPASPAVNPEDVGRMFGAFLRSAVEPIRRARAEMADLAEFDVKDGRLVPLNPAFDLPVDEGEPRAARGTSSDDWEF